MMQVDQVGGGISVVRDRHLVPLLPNARQKISSHQPWKHVLLERHLVHSVEIPEHEHPELCLHLQLSGGDDFEWWSGGRNSIERTQPGALILIPPGTRDRLRWRGSSDRYVLSLKQSAFAELGRDCGCKGEIEFRTRWSLYDSGLSRLVGEMGREAQSGWPLGHLYADLLVMGLQTHLLRTHSTNSHKPIAEKGGLSMPKLRLAMEYINANLADDIRLEEIAEQLGVSSSHFAHEFRNSTSQTPYQYLLDQRMARAKALLKSRDWSIQYISSEAGFRSSVNFVRTFRQRVGHTPEAWRKTCGSSL
jgi:AraC family transcriptional regulator